jgi:hypothetical protein
MIPEFILMLTYNDQTVTDASKIFEDCKDLPVTHWGFKDVGLPPNKMKALFNEMKKAGKTTYLEVVSLTEEEGLKGAKLAVEAGCDVLMGTVFFESIKTYLKGKPIKYFPFPGHIHGHPSILAGSIDEIVAHAKLLESYGVDGLDLLTYRFIGDAPLLLQKVVNAVSIPIVSAGSIESIQRISEVMKTGAWGFTIGSALFDKKFAPNGSFAENIQVVTNWIIKNSQ